MTRWAGAVAAVGLVLAVPVATWWLIGDQSTVPAGADPDYAFRPIAVGPEAERAAGIAATAIAVVALAVLVWATRRRHLDPHWWGTLVPLLVAGVIVGAGWRVASAGVIGANIGAGLAVMFGGPVVLVLVIWALISVIIRRARRDRQVPNQWTAR